MLTKVLPRSIRRHFWPWFTLIMGGLLGLNILVYLLAEGLWFNEVDFLFVFELRLLTQIVLGLFTFGVSVVWLVGNLYFANRWCYKDLPEKYLQPEMMARGWRLRALLPVVIGLAVLMGVMLVYQVQVSAEYWRPKLTLYSTTNELPIQFRPQAIWDIGQGLTASAWWAILIVIGFAIALILYNHLVSMAAAVLMSLGFGLVMSEQWMKILPFLRPTSFEQTDPLFYRDISFYVFRLPVWQLLEFWWIGLFSFGLVTVAFTYFTSGNSLSQGYFPGFTLTQQRHLCANGSGLLAAIALGHWLGRYELMYSARGVTFGASYTDVNAQLPVNTVLSFLALAIAIALLWRAIVWGLPIQSVGLWLVKVMRDRKLSLPTIPREPESAKPVMYGLSFYLLIAVVGGLFIPALFQRVVVEPNELELERPYIERTIALTRNAFALDSIEDEVFIPETSLTYEDLQENPLTINNIRLWDTRPLLETNRQLQEIRLYYEFLDADIDRYPILTADNDTELRQVLIAARELNYEQVPDEAKTWVNEHLIYTHGYGFTLSPVNTAGPSGLPDYFIRGIDQIPSSELIAQSIPIGEPRIYYGELTNTYVMTQTEVRELDYPSGSDNVYNTYSGRGGINIGSFWRRFLYADYLWDWRMLLTQDFTPETKLLFRRNIEERVKTIAPFLRYDNDPYLVTANPAQKMDVDTDERTLKGDPVTDNENYLYWIIDAYTTSDRYPYSEIYSDDFNYIRNSVKVVIDAYHGTPTFYVADPSDPIIQTWNKIFPDMFHSLDEMPRPLRIHIRYPQDFYNVQSDQLMTYHMTDPQVYYNREDQWRAPNEIYANEAQQVEPYYLILNLPNQTTAEFILFRPYTPAERNNLIAWLAARSDLENYGKLLLYRFPKQELVFGPEQIEARINQDPVISQQISLWNRQGSRAIQGNLLVIPIERSLLYVEPLYLQAEQNQLPTLARVIVAYGNRIAMAETLNQALTAIFEPDDPETPAILRELEADIPEDAPIDLEDSVTPTEETESAPSVPPAEDLSNGSEALPLE